jgi:SpoVK/Ycf46/Vps4 family AAA+-type ATPase
LASCWVGETEHNISRAFEEAEETNSILFLDEADSLFRSRNNSRSSWEITQVNEILTRMERFNGIFIASTNFLDNLDAASLRRFAFKLKFNELNNEGKVIFLKRFFNVSSNNYEDLYQLKNLTPGDYKAVRDKLSYMDVEFDYKMVVDELKNEIKYKEKQYNKKISF